MRMLDSDQGRQYNRERQIWLRGYFSQTVASRCSSVVEQCFRKAWAVGSNPTSGSFLFFCRIIPTGGTMMPIPKKERTTSNTGPLSETQLCW